MANLFKIKRLARGLEIRQVAEHLKVTPALVSAWERGQAWPGPRLIPALADFFGMQPEDFARELEEARLATSAA